MNLSRAMPELGTLAWGVVLAVLPLAVLFAVFQALVLKLPPREISRIVAGAALAVAGLFLFLVGVNVGFLPFGRAIGEATGALTPRWVLAPFGLLLGFVTTWGEPSVRILANQVEEASAGAIRSTLVLWTVSLGVAVAVAAGMLRIAFGLPLLYLLLPGYVIVVALLRGSDRRFVSIAIDAGGVATGPLANTFLLALALGASAAAGHADPLVHGLGLVALIALAPLISVMSLGVLVRLKVRPAQPKES